MLFKFQSQNKNNHKKFNIHVKALTKKNKNRLLKKLIN